MPPLFNRLPACWCLLGLCRQPACHLSGRFLPPQLLELPPQLMERLLLQPGVLARVCTHAVSQQPLPGHLADALAAYYSSRWAHTLLSVPLA